VRKKKKKGNTFLTFVSNVTSRTNKTIEEIDSWFSDYKSYIQELEPNLKNLQLRENFIIKQKNSWLLISMIFLIILIYYQR